MCSPETFSIASWSGRGSLFHLSSFMKKPNAELYIPPGNSVACSSTVSSLNEMIDSSGKKTPSATPLDSSSYDSGAGLTKAEAPSAFATCSAMPPPVRIFRPCTSAMPFTGFLVNICPGPCVNTPSSFTPLYSPTFWKYFQWIRERSEEHTSELQSQSNLVCRLLLEKKKKRKKASNTS